MLSSLRIGLRNLGRRKGRTALTIGMLLVATWMQSIMVSIHEGSYDDMIRMATGSWTGQAQIQHPHYRQSPALFETIADPAPILQRLREFPGVLGAAPRDGRAAGPGDDARAGGGRAGVGVVAAVDRRRQPGLGGRPADRGGGGGWGHSGD